MNSTARIGLLVVVLLVTAMLHQLLFLGKDPVASDTVQRHPINKWVSERGDGSRVTAQWFPNLFGGMPSYGGYINSRGGPMTAILRHPGVTLGLRYWIHFVVGGMGMFFFLRHRKVKGVGSILGSVLYCLTPYWFGLINAGHPAKVHALGYLPWVILAVDHVLTKSSWKSVPFLALATALQLWAKHPQIVYYTWMLVVFLFLWRQGRAMARREWTPGTSGKQTAIIVSGLAIALITVADPYTSMYQFQKHSNRGASSVLDESGDTERGTDWEYATQWSFHPKELVSFVYPYFYGLQNYPTRDLKSASYWGYMPFTQSTHYLGLFTLLLAFLGLLLKRPEGMMVAFWVGSILILLVGLGRYFPVLFWPLFKFAPFFSKFRIPSMIYTLLPFTMGYLAAEGLETAVHGLADRKGVLVQNLKKWGLRLFGIVAGLSLLMLIFGSTLSDSLGLFAGFNDSSKIPPEYLSQVKSVRWELFQKGMVLALVMSSAGLAVLWLGINRKITTAIVGWAVVCLAVIDLWTVNVEFLHLKPRGNLERLFRETDVVSFLSEDNTQFRILPLDDFNTNWYGYFGLQSVGGYRPVKLRTYQDLMDAGGLNSLPVLNMLNVKYLLTNRNLQSTQFRRVFQGEKLSVYENLSVLPRAWMVDRIEGVSDQRESLAKTVSREFDPSEKSVVVDYDGPDLTIGNGDNVRIANFSENRIDLEVRARGGKLLVLSENHYAPGWKASVDGKETEIYQTNHVLRSVFVPSGEHNVTFQYDTTLFRTSRLISRISLVFLLSLLAVVNRRSLKSAAKSFKRG